MDNHLTTLDNTTSSLQSDVLGVSNTISDLTTQVDQLAVTQATSSSKLAFAIDQTNYLATAVAKMNETITELQAGLSLRTQTGTGSADLTSTDTLISDGTNPSVSPDTLSAATIGDIENLEVSDTFRSLGYSFLGETTISQNLNVYGQTFLGDTAISGTLMIDNRFTLANNSINVTSSSDQEDGILYLQNSPLAFAVDIFNGAVTIDKTGTLVTKGDVKVAGNIQLDGGVTITATAGEDLKAHDALYVSDTGTVKKATATTTSAIIGIAATDAQSGEQVEVIISGKVHGFESLEVGKKYYVGTNGTITPTVTPTTTKLTAVGVALSETELILQISTEASASGSATLD